MVLRLAQPIHQDDHHSRGGDTEAGERGEDSESEGEVGVPGTGSGGEECEKTGVRGQEADQ